MTASATLGLIAVLASGAPLTGDDSRRSIDRYAHAPDRLLSYVHTGRTRAPIPTFARLYGTGCSTCHTAAPKLNVLGEAFRLAGYRMPENETLLRRDNPVALGAEPWKDQWPRSVWPSELSGISPLAFRLQTDVRAIGRPGGGRDLDFLFPADIYLLAAAPLGDDMSTFVEVEWSESRGVSVVQAKVAFQDFIPGLPDGVANLGLGRQDPFLLTFTDRQIDRAGVLGFSWQFFQPSQLSLTGPGGATLRSGHRLALGGGLSTIEVNGVAAGRLHYGLGVSQGGGGATSDNNGSKDPYYRLRYKWGGLNLRGQYDPGGGPVLGTGGQLQDRALIVEHFGYRGNESTTDAPEGSHWATGLSTRVLYGPWDVGTGWVRRVFERPFDTSGGDLRGTNWFAKIEYLVFPWLMASLKYDRLDVSADPGAIPTGFTLDPGDRRSFAPGAVLLLRQNVRAVVESRLFMSGDARRGVGVQAPGDFFLRLDIAF